MRKRRARPIKSKNQIPIQLELIKKQTNKQKIIIKRRHWLHLTLASDWRSNSSALRWHLQKWKKSPASFLPPPASRHPPRPLTTSTTRKWKWKKRKRRKGPRMEETTHGIKTRIFFIPIRKMKRQRRLFLPPSLLAAWPASLSPWRSQWKTSWK